MCITDEWVDNKLLLWSYIWLAAAHSIQTVFAGDKIKQSTMWVPVIEDKHDVEVAINFVTGAPKPSSMEKLFSSWTWLSMPVTKAPEEGWLQLQSKKLWLIII